jgi:hypothetical protein
MEAEGCYETLVPIKKTQYHTPDGLMNISVLYVLTE